MTAGPAADIFQITGGTHFGETGLDVGQTGARGRTARATGEIGATAGGETLFRPTPSRGCQERHERGLSLRRARKEKNCSSISKRTTM